MAIVASRLSWLKRRGCVVWMRGKGASLIGIVEAFLHAGCLTTCCQLVDGLNQFMFPLAI